MLYSKQKEENTNGEIEPESGNIRKTSDPDTFRNVQTIMDDMKEEFRDLVDSFVCIKNPSYHIFTSDSKYKYTLEGAFWIGKIESVDGFMIGIME